MDVKRGDSGELEKLVVMAEEQLSSNNSNINKKGATPASKEDNSNNNRTKNELTFHFMNQPEFKEQVLQIMNQIITSQTFKDVVVDIYKSTNPIPSQNFAPPTPIQVQPVEQYIPAIQQYPQNKGNEDEIKQESNVNINPSHPAVTPVTLSTSDESAFVILNKQEVPPPKDNTKNEDWTPVLKQLQDMGFNDDASNMKLLIKHQGSVMKTVEELLGSLKV